VKNINQTIIGEGFIMIKKKILFLCMLLFIFGSAGIAGASSYSFSPYDADLGDLEHAHYYTWGINWTLPTNQVITGATLSFDNINDWTAETTDRLYIHLLDFTSTSYAALGANHYTSGTDTDNTANDKFSGRGVLLATYSDTTAPYGEPNGTTILGEDLLLTFTQAQLTSLGTYLTDGYFGFGFDPDCHFYNDGVTLTITTANPAPEPATMLLLGSGLVGLGRLRKKIKKS
jgi:hypothetical protein